MTEDEIKQIVANAVNDAITPLMEKVAELNKPAKEPEKFKEQLEGDNI